MLTSLSLFLNEKGGRIPLVSTRLAAPVVWRIVWCHCWEPVVNVCSSLRRDQSGYGLQIIFKCRRQCYGIFHEILPADSSRYDAARAWQVHVSIRLGQRKWLLVSVTAP